MIGVTAGCGVMTVEFIESRKFSQSREERGMEKEECDKGERRWEQAGRATEIMKKEWETWMRGGVTAHNNSISLNSFETRII